METTRDNQRVGLVPAAGLSTRLGIATPKELLLFRGKAIINYSIEDLVEAGVESIVVVIRSGKESIRDHLNQAFPSQHFAFVFQSRPIGNLLDAIRASYPSIRGKEVLFRMADTYLDPNPFGVVTRSPSIASRLPVTSGATSELSTRRPDKSEISHPNS